jgi:Arc/MetJ-type ribon-helix-helix transcriptional regulator
MAAVDEVVASGRYGSRSDVLRAGLARVLAEERGRAIDEAYRRGYGEHPQEEWVGELGLAGLAALDRAEGDTEL